MTYTDIINDLNNKIYHPIYFLGGEEPYFIDKISETIEDIVLTDSEKEFNQNVLYGLDVDVQTLISYAKRYPMMSNYQVIIVKEAQDFEGIDELENYASNPVESTILVLCYKYKKFDSRKKFARNIKKNGVWFESKKLYDYKIPQWINEQVENEGYTITPKASALINEFLGNDLSKISNEINKLIINLPDKTKISDEHIEEYIGISKDYNVFELQKALGKKDIVRANQIINYFKANPKEKPIVLVMGVLFSYFNKVLIYHQLKDKSKNNVASVLSIHPFFVNDYKITAQNYPVNKIVKVIDYLREYDLKSKGVDNNSMEGGELLKELVYKILH